MAKNWSELYNFHDKVLFFTLFFYLRKCIFFFFFFFFFFFTFLYLFLMADILQQYCENFRKFEQVERVKNLPPIYLPVQFLHSWLPFLLYEKMKIFDCFKLMTRTKKMCICS